MLGNRSTIERVPNMLRGLTYCMFVYASLLQ